MNEREILLDEIITDHDVDSCIVTRAEGTRGKFQFRRPHVIRRYVDQVTPEPHAFDGRDGALDVSRLRHDKRRTLARSVRLVAAEGISTEAPGNDSHGRIAGCRVTETIRAGRQDRR